MPLPEGFPLNALIVRLEHPVRGYGGDVASQTVVLRDVPASRQPRSRLLFDEVNGREERTDTDFFFDLPEDPFAVRLGDLVTWRRLVNGKAVGSEIADAEVRAVEVNDMDVDLSHVRIATRGADGTGA